MPPIPNTTDVVRQRDVPAAGTVTDGHGTVTDMEQSYASIPADKKCVGISGIWYDVTDFIKRHPGGPIIEEFVGKDATQAFMAFRHNMSWLKQCKVMGSYTPHERHPADDDFDQLVKMFNEKGFFETDYGFYAGKIGIVLGLWGLVWVCVLAFSSWWIHMLGAVTLAFVFQQCGFAMHELMHKQVTKSRNWDRAGGVCIGTVLFGFSAHWWHDEHIIHHTMTNVVDTKRNVCLDMQMWECTWAQNEKMFFLFRSANKVMSYIQLALIKIQHITFVPLVMFGGRLEILSDSIRVEFFELEEKRWYEQLAIIAHWTWMITLLSFLPTWGEVALFYLIAASVEGIFHFQLILSHYAKAFYTVPEFHKSSWYASQVSSNMNIETPWWQDWYYGGLNYHIEHHLFPKMNRNFLRHASPYVREVCKKHNIDYDMVPMTEALAKTLRHLKETGAKYQLMNDRWTPEYR